MANGDILACRVLASAGKLPGAILEIDVSSNTVPGAGGGAGAYSIGLGPKNDPATAKVVITLTSAGYDNTGASTTWTRTVYATQYLRQALTVSTPDDSKAGTTLTLRFVLSDFIYGSDTISNISVLAGLYTQGGQATNAFSGACTNSSTLAYPSCVGRFIWPGFESLSGTSFKPEFFGVNRFARNGQPLACAKFTLTDGTTTVTKTVTDLTISPKGGPTPNTGLPWQSKPNTVLAYIPDFDPTAFTQAAVLTLNVVAYPWIGDSGALLDSSTGPAPPSEVFGPLKFICDKTGAYGTPAVVYDPTNGATWASGSANVRATEAAAWTAYDPGSGGVRTVSYNTLGGCESALKAYNNTNNGRNNPGNGVVIHSGIGAMQWNAGAVADMGVQDTWMTIKAGPGVGRAAAVITSAAQAWPGSRKIKIYDCTISGTAVGLIVGDQTLATIWPDYNTINSTGDPCFYLWKCCYATRNDIQALSATGLKSFGSGAHSPFALIRGNVGAPNAEPPGHAYCLIGNYNISPTFVFPASAGDNPAADAIGDNSVVAFNTHYQLSAAGINWFKMHVDAVVIIGVAVIQNVCEKNTNDTDVLTAIGGDGCNGALNNIILWHNTWQGNRFNAGYNDGTGTGGVAASFLHKNWSLIGNMFENFNNKDDTFGTANAARVGSWCVGYWVGARGNTVFAAVGGTEWLGEFPGGLFSVIAGRFGFVKDTSWDYENTVGRQGGGTVGPSPGNGDYHLTEQSAGFALMGAGTAVLPYDIEGNPRMLTGGSAGAYEKRAVGSVPTMR